MEDSGEEVVIKVSDTLTKCKKSDLVRQSSYFQAMFLNQFKESEKEVVELKEVDPDAVKVIIDWVNTGSIDVVENMEKDDLLDVLQASNMLQFSFIQERCVENLLEKFLDATNCLGIMEKADLLAEEKLFVKAKKVSLWNFEEAVKSDDFLQLDLGPVIKYLSNPQANVKGEMNVFNAAMSWIGDKEEEREGHLETLLQAVIFLRQVSDKELEQMLEHSLIKRSGGMVGSFLTSVLHLRTNVAREDSSVEKDLDDITQWNRDKVRQLPLQPCVVGHRLPRTKAGKKRQCLDLDNWEEAEESGFKQQTSCVYHSRQKVN